MIRFLTLSLALLIAVTSQQMAVARGVMFDAAGQVVICTGEGVRTVAIDHNGAPIEIVHICPDCALTLAADFSEPPEAPVRVIHMQLLGQTPVPGFEIALIPNAAHPRGPPLFV